MSKYTTEVRFICENASGMNESAGYSSIDTVISGAIPKIFDFTFPIFDENYRNVLCGKILKHYYTREICEETVGLWKLRLSTRLNEIMPYYNQLYKSEALEFNPLFDVDYTRDGERNHDGTDNVTKSNTQDTEENITNQTDKTTDSDSETTTEASTSMDKTERDMYSDTPQGALTNLENGEYLTNARKKTGEESDKTTGSATNNFIETVNDNFTGNRKVKNTESGNDNRTISSTEDYLEHISGKMGSVSYSKMLMEFRETFLNIDMMVINALADLFFNLW